ncbi:TonB family protein [Herbaspirillum lusitanum]|uniref:TonB family protein n=1 Tax=Herbaspirillum lusitanum TaxID=213312 RepID=A0ABW9AGK6_9BURK
MSVIVLPHPNDIFAESLHAGKRWWQNRGTAGSLLLHVLLIAAVYFLSTQTAPTPTPERAIELVLAPPEPKVLTPPPPPEVKPEPQKAVPKPAVPRPAPVPVQRTAPVAAEKAEVAAPPTPPAPPPEPVKAAPPEPPPAPRPRVISNDGIPSDYVNQVYSRINGKTTYPRVAKLRGDEGRVSYKITLNPQGELLKYDIQSSGNEVLDKAAVEAIKAAAPFPRLPDLGGSSYLLSGAIVFALR